MPKPPRRLMTRHHIKSIYDISDAAPNLADWNNENRSILVKSRNREKKRRRKTFDMRI